uniref:Uncharacterized protein n=1 Tax=Noctiluca scintillans TaxID=2966 RepID=A0A7S1AUX3_NOCSC
MARDWSSERDLLGVHGDVLFADPLGVREPEQPQRQKPPRTVQVQSGREIRKENSRVVSKDAAEDPNWMRYVFDFVVSSSTECCSMRNREAQAKKPEEQPTRFPRPPKSILGSREMAPQTPSVPGSAAPHNDEGVHRGSALSSGVAVPDASRASGTEPPVVSFRADVDASRTGSGERSSSADSDISQTRVVPRVPRPAAELLAGDLGPRMAPWAESDETDMSKTAVVPRAQRNLDMSDTKIVPRTPEISQTSQRPHTKDDALRPLPTKWKWPEWCLDRKNPAIEVYVIDEETGEGRWCSAEPESRVVDKYGGDNWLSAEYEWDDDYYVQDFGPRLVRRRGTTETVFDMVQKSQGVPNHAGDLQRPRRPGAGVSSWLDDSS